MSKRSVQHVFVWWSADKKLVGIYTNLESMMDDMCEEDLFSRDEIPKYSYDLEGQWLSQIMHESDEVIEVRSLNTPNQNDLFQAFKHRKVLCTKDSRDKGQFSDK